MPKYSVTYRESKDYSIEVEADGVFDAEEKVMMMIEEEGGVLAGMVPDVEYNDVVRGQTFRIRDDLKEEDVNEGSDQ